MFTKLILQLKSERIYFFYRFHDTILIRLSMDITSRFLPKAYRKEISNGKLYRVTAPVRTTVPQLFLQQSAILTNHLTSSLKKRAYNFYSYCQKNQWLPGACNRSPGSKLLSITTQLHCGSHLGRRAQLPDTILQEDHPMTIPSKFGFN
jgi:hypothetical protein